MKLIISFAILFMVTYQTEGNIENETFFAQILTSLCPLRPLYSKYEYNSPLLTIFRDNTDRVICYLGSWANYRNGNGRYTPEDIDPGLCTHIIYTFMGIENNGSLKILDSYLEIDLKNMVRFNSLKTINPNLKTLVAVGGWNEGSVKYSAMAADPLKREALINSAVKILETYGFDGFDIDWEYPAQRGGSAADKANFVTLLKEFRDVFNKKGYLLTAAVAATSNSVDISYDVPALSKYLDFINVMTYDLHGSYDGVTGANAPLFPSHIDTTLNAKKLNVDAAVRGWISRGAEPYKLSMGIPMYGRTFTLSKPNVRGLGAPSSSGGNPGPYTQETGMLGYLEICEKLKQERWSVQWDNYTKTPYAFKDRQWISYENEESIKLKVEHAIYLKLGGIMIWSLETEDFRGICGKKYPLLNTINNVIHSSNKDQTTPRSDPETVQPVPVPDPNPEPVPEPQQTTQPSPTSKSQPKSDPDTSSTKPDTDTNREHKNSDDEQLCKYVGLVRDPNHCHVFYYCIPRGSSFQQVKSVCAGNLVFDPIIKNCNYRHLVNCHVGQ